MAFYIILDSHLKRIGILDNDHGGTTPFYGDLITKQIAEEGSTYDISSVKDSLNISNADLNANNKSWNHVLESIYVPYGYPDTDKIAQGNHLAFQDPDNGKYYVFRLTSITDSVDDAGQHYKQATGVNLCIWKLGKTVPFKKDIKNANSKTAFNNLLAGTGWYTDPNAELIGGSMDISFDGTSSAQSQLQSFCQAYGAEVDAYVIFDESWNITMKRINIVRRLGTDEGKRVEYARNITGISRNVVDDNLYTKLFVYGADGSSCLCAKSDNKPFVFDSTANAIYNPPIDGSGRTYLEGAITSNSIKDPTALYDWGMKQLKIFNHPRANYTVDIDNDFNAHLGDTIRVLDLEMKPELTVQARVIKKQTSFSDFTQNKVILGEFTTVNVIPPEFIRNMTANVENTIARLLDKLKKNPNALSAVIDKPNGTSWSDVDEIKQFIAHVSVLGDDISSSISDDGYIWELLADGVSSKDFYKQYNGQNATGQRIVLNHDEVGELRLSIDTDKIQNVSEITFDDNASDLVFTLAEWTDSWGEKHTGDHQFAQYSADEDCYYVSAVYKGKQDTTKYNALGMSSIISRFKPDGTYMDSMILIGSRANGSFGVQSTLGTHFIWTNLYKEENNQVTYACRIQYQPGKVISNDRNNYYTYFPYRDKYMSVYYDNSSDKVMINRFNDYGTVEIYDVQDVYNLNQTPTNAINRIDYGFQPKNAAIELTGDATDKQTFQTGSLRFPYYFFDSGDINMSDQRYIWCVNVITKTLVFQDILSSDLLGANYKSYFEPKTFNWLVDGIGVAFLVGANYDNTDDKYAIKDRENRVVGARTTTSLWKVNYLERAKSAIYNTGDGGDIELN